MTEDRVVPMTPADWDAVRRIDDEDTRWRLVRSLDPETLEALRRGHGVTSDGRAWTADIVESDDDPTPRFRLRVTHPDGTVGEVVDGGDLDLDEEREAAAWRLSEEVEANPPTLRGTPTAPDAPGPSDW